MLFQYEILIEYARKIKKKLCKKKKREKQEKQKLPIQRKQRIRNTKPHPPPGEQ